MSIIFKFGDLKKDFALWSLDEMLYSSLFYCSTLYMFYFTIGQLPSLHFNLFFVSSLVVLFCYFCCSDVFLALQSLFVFVDEDWKVFILFMCTFYLLFIDNFSLHCLSDLNEFESNREHSTTRVGCFSLFYSKTRTIKVPWLKPSNENRGLRVISSSTAVNQAVWTYCIFPLVYRLRI